MKAAPIISVVGSMLHTPRLHCVCHACVACLAAYRPILNKASNQHDLSMNYQKHTVSHILSYNHIHTLALGPGRLSTSSSPKVTCAATSYNGFIYSQNAVNSRESNEHTSGGALTLSCKVAYLCCVEDMHQYANGIRTHICEQEPLERIMV
jgi:hypothetical protein